jgi:mono/diheme cytochrome c family protein
LPDNGGVAEAARGERNVRVRAASFTGEIMIKTISRSMPLLATLIAGCVAAPERAPDLMLPVADFRVDAATGKGVFDRYCAACHGAGGAGTENGPPLVHKTYRTSHHSDMSFYKAVQRGVHAHHWRYGNMPSIPDVDPQMTAHVIAYVRAQQRAAGIE